MTNAEARKWIKKHHDYKMNTNGSVAMRKAMTALSNVDKYEKAIATLAGWMIDCEDCDSECMLGYTDECPYNDVMGKIIEDTKCVPAICNHVKKENGIVDDDEIIADIGELNEDDE